MRALDTFAQDLRHSLRMFRQSPAFTLAAVAALTLGIGVNTAIFSVVNAVLLRPLAFPDPDRIVVFLNTSAQGRGGAASPAKFQHYRAQTDVVEDVSAFRTGVVNLTGGTFPEQLRSGQVSKDFFTLLGAPVQLGRTFTAEEDGPDGPRAVILSDAFWRRRFNASPDAIGRSLSLGGDSFTVVGVLGAGFDPGDLGGDPEVWTAFRFDPDTGDQGHYFEAIGRVRDGVTMEQARARIEASAAAYRDRFPSALLPENGFTIEPLPEMLVSNARTSLVVLAGAVAFVLLIACANVASLLLVRATGRRREMAIRAAIGAGRGRIVRQLLTESVVLALVGGVLGLAAGLAGIRALLAINTAGLPRIGEAGALVTADWRVVLFTMAVAVGTGILFGLIPAVQGSRADLSLTIKESGARSGSSVRQNRTRTVLVILEVAMAVVLLIGSALLIRTSVALASVDPGYDTDHILTMRMSLTGPRFQQSRGVELMVQDGIQRLRAIPGVEQATAACCVPLEGGYGLPFIIVARPLEGTAHGGGGWLPVSEGYFEVLHIPVRRGRAFTERDTGSGPPVVIINETMARQFWPDGDPLTDRLSIGDIMREFADDPDRQIVGIVGDVRDNGLDVDPQPKMYVPQGQVPDAANALNVSLTPMAWFVRTRVEPHSVSASVQEQLRQTAGLPVSNVRTMAEVVSRSTSRERFNMWLMSVFGAAALLLAAIGIYGLMAYSVAQRRQEIGIRMALGAEVGQVRRMVVTQGLRLALIGVALGTVAALVLSRFIASWLFGVQARDPLVFIAVPIALTTVALLAVWLPALRASRVNPMAALRIE